MRLHAGPVFCTDSRSVGEWEGSGGQDGHRKGFTVIVGNPVRPIWQMKRRRRAACWLAVGHTAGLGLELTSVDPKPKGLPSSAPSSALQPWHLSGYEIARHTLHRSCSTTDTPHTDTMHTHTLYVCTHHTNNLHAQTKPHTPPCPTYHTHIL